MQSFIYRNLFGILLLSFLIPKVATAQQADRLVGHWLFPSKGSGMTVYQQGDRYFARVAEVDQDGKKNFGLVKGAVLIQDLTYDGRIWSDGRLVHPKTGIKLNVDVVMENPQEITVTIYKGIRLLHRKFVMTRKTVDNSL